MRVVPLLTCVVCFAGACTTADPRNDEPPPPQCLEYDEPALAGWIEVPGLREASGLAASHRHEGVLYTHNDSGYAPELFALRTDGSWAGTWTLHPAANVDWEDIARGPCEQESLESCLYIGDVGDNLARREEVVIYVVAEPDLPEVPGEGRLEVRRTIRARYPEGPRDCETLLVHPQTADIYLVDKPAPAGEAHGVYRISRGGVDAGETTVTLERVADVVADPSSDRLFTGGDVHPDGTRIVLRTYGVVQEHRVPEGRGFEEAFAAPHELLPPFRSGAGVGEIQGEAAAYARDGRAVYTTSEGERPPLNRRVCLDD